MRNEICIGFDAYNQLVTGGVSRTLNTSGEGIPIVLVYDARGNGGGRFRGGYVPMIVDTLVFDEGQITSKQNGNHPTWGGQCHSLSGNAGRTVVIIREEHENIQQTEPVSGIQSG